MAAASIIVDLLMRTASFQTDTERAGRALQKLSKQSKDSATAIAGEFKRVQDAIAKAGMTANQQKLFDLKQLGASQQQLKAYARNLDELDRKTKSLSTSTLSLSNSVKTAAGAFGVGVAFTQITQLSDSYTKFTAQLKNATTSAGEFGSAYQNVQRVAQSTQFDIEAVGTTYSRLSQATRDLGISQQQVSDIVETIGLSLKTQGATTAEASSAMLQLSQAFGKGKLDGDEFRSAMENVPGLMRVLAQSMGVPFGALKDLASEGQITAEVLIKAFSDQALLNSLREQGKEIRTISGGYTEIGNQIKLLVGETNNATGATSLYAKTLAGVASLIEKIRSGGGFDSGFLASIPGGQAFSVFNQAGRSLPKNRQSSGGTITRTPTPAATPSQTFDELSKGLNLASIKMKELVKTQEEAVRSLNTGKISYDQYKEIIAATGKEMQSLTEKNTKNARSTRDNSSAITDFARQQQDVANILQKARDLNAPELSKFDQLQEELDAYTRLNPAVREYAENMILAAKTREQADQWQEVMVDQIDREIEAYNEATEAQEDFEQSIKEYVESVQRAADPTIELTENISKLQSALSLGLIDQETFDQLEKFLNENEKTSDEVTEFWRKAAESIQSTFSDVFFDAMEGELGDLEQTFRRTINRIVADLAATQFSGWLFGDDFGKGGKIGGKAGDFFGWIGSTFGDFFGDMLPSFDVGTPYVQRDMVAKIHKGERILTAQENRAFSAGKMAPQINMTVYANDAGSFMRSSGQIAKGLQRQLNQAQRVS
jgi:tape measure domain-containing protein